MRHLKMLNMLCIFLYQPTQIARFCESELRFRAIFARFNAKYYTFTNYFVRI